MYINPDWYCSERDHDYRLLTRPLDLRPTKQAFNQWAASLDLGAWLTVFWYDEEARRLADECGRSPTLRDEADAFILRWRAANHPCRVEACRLDSLRETPVLFHIRQE